MLMWINKAAFNVNFIKLMSHSEIHKKSKQQCASYPVFTGVLKGLEQVRTHEEERKKLRLG